jgi:predicted HicB family RNase H-like nuclease
MTKRSIGQEILDGLREVKTHTASTLEYKGYISKIEIDDEAGILYGEVINVRDVITFEGKSVAETQKAFQISVDDYLAFCAERHESPDRS